MSDVGGFLLCNYVLICHSMTENVCPSIFSTSLIFLLFSFDFMMKMWVSSHVITMYTGTGIDYH